MSILLNSTHEAQPWWDNERATWKDIPPEQLLYQDEYFGRREWGYNSTGIDWPSSRFIKGQSGVYDFSSIPCLATLSGSFTCPLTIIIDGEFPIWTADVEIVDRSMFAEGEFPSWTSDFHILSGDLLTFAGTFPPWTGIIEIPSGVVSFTGAFPRWSSNVTILSGGLFTFEGNFPLWASSVIITPDVGNFVIAGTFPTWSGIIQVRQVVSVYGATVMNASNYAVTEYATYPVKSIGYMNGHYYGVLSDGVYLLEGDDDSGTDVDAEIETGPVNFAEKVTTYPREAWIVYRSDGKVIFRIREDEQTVYEADISFTSERLREERAKFGRGLRDQFYAFGFKNKDGADFDLDSIAIDVDRVRGRIK